MKVKNLIVLIASVVLVGNADAYGQDKMKFFVLAGVGKGFNANEKDITFKDPTIRAQVGLKPTKGPLVMGVEMMIGIPFSPATKDSTLVTVPGDSTHAGYSYYKQIFQKTSLLTFNIGVRGGKPKGGMCGGINIGLGAGFTEHRGVLKDCFLSSVTLDGGYNIGGKVTILLSASYLYLGSSFQGFGSDGFTALGQISLMATFGGGSKDD